MLPASTLPPSEVTEPGDVTDGEPPPIDVNKTAKDDDARIPVEFWDAWVWKAWHSQSLRRTFQTKFLKCGRRQPSCGETNRLHLARLKRSGSALKMHVWLTGGIGRVGPEFTFGDGLRHIGKPCKKDIKSSSKAHYHVTESLNLRNEIQKSGLRSVPS